MSWIIPTQGGIHQKGKWCGETLLQFLMEQETPGMELFMLMEPLGCLQWPLPTAFFWVSHSEHPLPSWWH